VREIDGVLTTRLRCLWREIGPGSIKAWTCEPCCSGSDTLRFPVVRWLVSGRQCSDRSSWSTAVSLCVSAKHGLFREEPGAVKSITVAQYSVSRYGPVFPAEGIGLASREGVGEGNRPGHAMLGVAEICCGEGN
jgi:hypothetical protein